MAFDPEIYSMKIMRPTVFNGVWQPPRYFDNLDMASLVRFPAYLVDPLDEASDSIRESNAVCLAIRRYEEVPNPKHPILRLDNRRPRSVRGLEGSSIVLNCFGCISCRIISSGHDRIDSNS